MDTDSVFKKKKKRPPLERRAIVHVGLVVSIAFLTHFLEPNKHTFLTGHTLCWLINSYVDITGRDTSKCPVVVT